MVNALVIKSALAVNNPRLRLAGPDAMLYGGTILLIDSKPLLYPAQDSSGAFKEAISGVIGAQSPQGGGDAPTFANGMYKVASNAVGGPGIKFLPYNTPGLDLSVRQAAGSKRFLWVGYFKTDHSVGGNQQLFFSIYGNSNVQPGDPRLQFGVAYSGVNLIFTVSGQYVQTSFAPAVDTAYQLAAIVEIGSAGNTTSITYYATPVGQPGPILRGQYAVPYAAPAPLDNSYNSGCSFGNGVGGVYYNTGPAGLSFGRFLMEDLTQTQNNAEAQISKDYGLNIARFG